MTTNQSQLRKHERSNVLLHVPVKAAINSVCQLTRSLSCSKNCSTNVYRNIKIQVIFHYNWWQKLFLPVRFQPRKKPFFPPTGKTCQYLVCVSNGDAISRMKVRTMMYIDLHSCSSRGAMYQREFPKTTTFANCTRVFTVDIYLKSQQPTSTHIT